MHSMIVFQVTPVQEGSMLIMAHDLCVDSKTTAKSQLHISGVNTIIINVVDKVGWDAWEKIICVEIKIHVMFSFKKMLQLFFFF